MPQFSPVYSLLNEKYLHSSVGAGSVSESTACAAASSSSDAESSDDEVESPSDAVPEFSSESVTVRNEPAK